MVAERAREPFFRVFAGIAGVIAAFALADLALVRADRSDRQFQGERLYQEGERLMRQQHYEEAADRFREALTQLPRTPRLELALVRTFSHQGKLDEAEAGLTRFLQRYPTQGDANLLMARTLRARGRSKDAAWYYHRAIYGSWPENARDQLTAVRFELADLLAADGQRQDLLAELLPLQEVAQLDEARRSHLASLYLVAQSWTRAADLYRAEIRTRPDQPSAYIGLGDAEFGAAQYPRAMRAYQTAAQLAPEQPAIREKMAQTREIFEMDPTLRGLTGKERDRRSRALLQRTLEATTICRSENSDVIAARDRLTAKTTDSDEDNIALAERLWRQRPASCPADPVLTLLFDKLAQ